MSPLVSIAGEGTAVPAAIVMVCASTLAVLAFACAGRRGSSTNESEHVMSEVKSVATVATDVGTYEDVVGRHLERFGERDELTVEWVRADTP